MRRSGSRDEVSAQLANVEHPGGARLLDIFPEARRREFPCQAEGGGVADAVRDAGEKGRCVE